LQKSCKCGGKMGIRIRTVIFRNSVEIENVPVYSCQSCHYSEVLPEVKKDLADLIENLGRNPQKKILRFEEMNELAHLLIQATSKERRKESIEQIVEERINELLDLLLLSQSLNDGKWREEIRKRLTELSGYALTKLDC